MLQCGVCGWNESMEGREGIDSRCRTNMHFRILKFITEITITRAIGQMCYTKYQGIQLYTHDS